MFFCGIVIFVIIMYFYIVILLLLKCEGWIKNELCYLYKNNLYVFCWLVIEVLLILKIMYYEVVRDVKGEVD